MAHEDVGAVIGATVEERAYSGPFFVFLAFFAVAALISSVFEGRAFWMFASPSYWVFPLQALVPGLLLIHYRKWYSDLRLRRISWSIAIGLLALAVWISPQWLFGHSRRLTGFDPGFFGPGTPYVLNLSLRLIRAVVVVPIVEELFWRGFLLRFLVDSHFTSVAVGTRTWFSFFAVTLGFTLEHQPADYLGAALTGALYNLVAYRTGSLGSCILAHAITNLGLCLYVLTTHQWGFW